MTRLPIRVRLTLGFAAAMAVVLTAVGVFVYDRVAKELLGTVDVPGTVAIPLRRKIVTPSVRSAMPLLSRLLVAAPFVEPACRHLPVDRAAIGADGTVGDPAFLDAIADVWDDLIRHFAQHLVDRRPDR